jgi:hypothetical protein
MHQPKKNDRNTIDCVCPWKQHLILSLSSLNLLVPLLLGGALTDWMLAHSLTNFMSQRCWW